MVNETSLNLAGKPGWQRLTADDLRAMAAQALRVSMEEVRFFYRDEDFLIEPTGRATIRQRKDALYVLEDGDFERAHFMSCMGVMNWPSIDFLPVVELFKSLLPGTGSAVFELIRGLYDDQNDGGSTPRPLRYRGIPTYPSAAAFRLFSSFFTPQAAGGSDPFTLFMNPERSSRVVWLPAATMPIRYFDQRTEACLTFQGGLLHRATVASDSSGLSYVSPKGRRFVPCDRRAEISEGHIVLKDRNHETTLAVTLPQGSLEQSGVPVAMSPVDWRSVFAQGFRPSFLPTPTARCCSILKTILKSVSARRNRSWPIICKILASRTGKSARSFRKPGACSSTMAMPSLRTASRSIGRETIPCWYGIPRLRKNRRNNSGVFVPSCSGGIGSRIFDSCQTKGCTIKKPLTPMMWSTTGRPMTEVIYRQAWPNV